MRSFPRVRAAFSLPRWSEFALARGRCSYCGPTLFVRLCSEAVGVRCLRCRASAVHLAMRQVLEDHVAAIDSCDACELSAHGPFARFLRGAARSASFSEYFAGVEPGSLRRGIRCEDLHRLTYPDASFDLVTHTEVLEHVADDARVLRELHRVLRPGGTMLFTVPMHGGPSTVERARLRNDGAIEHLQNPVYHLDPLRPEGILAFRDYGRDIVDRIAAAGFVGARIVDVDAVPWLRSVPVLIAHKA
jgi:SAM-dependent methyltransferase